MSSEKYIPFGVKASNLASVANFSSTMEDSYILIVANNCNTPVDNGNSYDTMYNDLNNAALFGVNVIKKDINLNDQEAYIGVKTNDLSHKIAKFNRESINLDVNTIINGNLNPLSSNYDIGSISHKWHNLYLSDSLYCCNIYCDGSGITNINLNDKSTSYLLEGSNLYYTSERFNNDLKNSSLDVIQEGTSNKFIVNHEYDNSLSINGIISVDSIYIRDAAKFQEENPDMNWSFTYNVTEVIAESTSVVLEGSNLYYKPERVGVLIDSSNENMSNYIDNIYDTLSFNMNKKYDQLSSNILDQKDLINHINSNIEKYIYIESLENSKAHSNISNYIDKLSVVIENKNSNISNYVSNTSSDIYKYISDVNVNVSNYIETREVNITGAAETIVTSILPKNIVVVTGYDGKIRSSDVKVKELEYLIGTSNSIQLQIDGITNNINNLSLDSIDNGDSNKYIINNIYDNDLHILGSLYASNLYIKGDVTSINTYSYETETLHILNDNSYGTSFVIDHNSDIHNIFEVNNNNDLVFIITKDNNIGIGRTEPSEVFDVNGNVKANIFIGSGENLHDVYISDKSTTDLPEGENLYFTKERVSEIINYSNINISNLIYITSNKIIGEVKTLIDNSSNKLSSNIYFNMSNYVGITKNNIISLIDSSYLNSLTYTSLKDANVSNYISKVLTNENNKDENVSNYISNVVTNEKNKDENVSNYISKVVTTIQDNDDHMSNYVSKVVTIIQDKDDHMSNYVSKVVTTIQDNDDHISNYVSEVVTIIQDNDDHMSNYVSKVVTIIQDNDDNMSNYVSKVVTTIQDNDDHMSNYVSEVVTIIQDNNDHMSNYLSEVVTTIQDNDDHMSNYVSRMVTIIKDNDDNISNYIFEVKESITEFLDTDDIVEGTSNKFIVNDSYDGSLLIKNGGITTDYLIIGGIEFSKSFLDSNLSLTINANLDTVTNGTSNRFIENNVYSDSLKIEGTLEADNILIHNNISIINESIYSSECVNIVNYTDNPSLLIKQIGNGKIFEFENDYSNIFNMLDNGYFGNKMNPQYNIDIDGVINTTYIKGDGHLLYNVNLIDKNTSELIEGSNLYFTEERVFEVLYGSNYNSSNQFMPRIENIYSNVMNTLEDTKQSLYCINLDKIVQGAMNKYIVDNIYNDSLVINGTLTVKDVKIIDSEFDTYDNIYNSNLYKCNSNVSDILEIGKTNTSNIVISILENVLEDYINYDNLSNFTKDIIINNISDITQDINNLNTDVNNLETNLSNVTYSIGNIGLDNVTQGTSNKYITDNTFNGSLFINGTLTVKDINIIETDSYDPYTDPNMKMQSVSQFNNNNISNIMHDILSDKNFESQINKSYELLSYVIETETTTLSNRLNIQANEISLLKNNINILMQQVAELQALIT